MHAFFTTNARFVRTSCCHVLRAYLFPGRPDLCDVCWTGISQLMFIIKPCAQLAPHHHPRADELLTVIEGAGLLYAHSGDFSLL